MLSPLVSFGKIEVTADTTQHSSRDTPELDMPSRSAGDLINRGRWETSGRPPELTGLRPVLVDARLAEVR